MKIICSSCRVGGILHSSFFLHGFGKYIFLLFDHHFFHHDLWSHLSQMLPHSGVVSPICSREVLLVKHPLLIYLHLLQSWITPIILRYLLFRVDDVGIIMALLWRIASCRLHLIIREDGLENYFQYLRSCMPQWKFLRVRWQVHIIGLRLNDSGSVLLQHIHSQL